MWASRTSLAAIYARVAALDAEYATFTCDHSRELKVAYAEVEELKAKLASAKRAVSDAYDDHRPRRDGYRPGTTGPGREFQYTASVAS